MLNQNRIGVHDLVVGQRYLHVNGTFVRTIDGIDGDTVLWHDKFGSGRCSKKVFLRQCLSIAPASVESNEQELLQKLRNSFTGEFTVRDEANALTAYAFRNGFLEDLHAGKSSPLLRQPDYSRITDEEMKRLMIDASSKLESLLRLKQNEPEKYEVLIRSYNQMYCGEWEQG